MMYIPSDIETERVFKIYDEISLHFSDTRGNVWNSVKLFLDKQLKGSQGLEIGCGNGKNMLYRNNELNIIGIDTCQNLLNICKQRNLNVKLGNALDLIFKENTFDFALSVAVFHHISDDYNRKKALFNLIRQLKKGGKGLVTVWAVEQEVGSNKKFKPGDNLVKWHKPRAKFVKTEFDVYERYYFVYTEKMFNDYINNFNKLIKIENVFNEKGNWFCEFTKI